jgi:hypothetical protein
MKPYIPSRRNFSNALFALLVFSFSFPISGCSQQPSEDRAKPETVKPPATGGSQIHLHTETWENGQRKIIDTTITMGQGMNQMFQFGDSIMTGDPFGDFNMEFPGFSFPGGGMGMFSDSTFSSPFFNFGAPNADFEELMKRQQQMMEDFMKQMPLMPSAPKKDEHQEDIVDI